ncbi:OmpA family protein [Novosphingobium malaysiense]|uniref:OmpA family protein n=1 Tax=Novosphingobium malaysiense TaxID=1348853 RepID=UPI0009DE6DB1|nr:OmpA family protein [Novosphingobium malaysiense]
MGANPGVQATETALASATPDVVESPVEPSPTAEPKKSIIRPDVSPTPTEAPPLEPEQITVHFADKSDEPDEEGITALNALLHSATFKAGGPITIWGHTDSRGTDTANMKASRERAEAVREYLATKDVADERMTVIPLGESRPVAPNRNLDGSDNPEGRAKNRRVEVRVEPPQDEPGGTEQEIGTASADTAAD